MGGYVPPTLPPVQTMLSSFHTLTTVCQLAVVVVIVVVVVVCTCYTAQIHVSVSVEETLQSYK